jgi:hypothetical protein
VARYGACLLVMRWRCQCIGTTALLPFGKIIDGLIAHDELNNEIETFIKRFE